MDITGIDLLQQKAGGYITLRCLWISLILIYLINMQVGYVVKLD